MNIEIDTTLKERDKPLPNGGVRYETHFHSRNWIRGRDVVLLLRTIQERQTYRLSWHPAVVWLAAVIARAAR